MTRHLADHRSPSQGARIVRYLSIDRSDGDCAVWRRLLRPQSPANGNRRLVEFLRIARGHNA